MSGELMRGRAIIVSDALTQEGEQRKLLGEYVAHHMQEDTDYGVIPGTKNRTLLKPGAEKLTTLFRCVPRFVIEEKVEDWETGLFFYRFACHIETLDGGNVVAEGVGSCSTYESRYRWRNADRTCPECGAAAILRSKFPPKNDPQAAPGWYCFAKKGGCGANFSADDERITGQATGRVQNPDLADCANTVLKMAKKRAHVDAAIALARCSDIFTQDAEDFREASPQPPVAPTAPQTDDTQRWLDFFAADPPLSEFNQFCQENFPHVPEVQRRDMKKKIADHAKRAGWVWSAMESAYVRGGP